ncbi:MAG: M24 family metallopeptidase [Actinomycetota bacterium]
MSDGAIAEHGRRDRLAWTARAPDVLSLNHAKGTGMNHEARIEGLRAKLDGLGVDALLVTNLTNVRYLTGFSGTNGQVLVSSSEAVFLSDPRYAARAADLVQGAEVVIYPSKLVDLLPGRVEAAGVARLGIEARTMTVAQRDDLAGPLEGVELVSTSNVVEGSRRAKDAEEIAAIREAVRLGDEAFMWILDRLAPGKSERDIALELEVRIRRQGAEDVSFEPIVGSGPLSAHIHHTPSERPFEDGDLVLLDFGSLSGGYCSDLTRTVVLGSASERQRVIYSTVLEAQARGIAAVAVDAPCAEVDGVARELIATAGHGDAFPHGLGHGVGLDIHEAPTCNRLSEERLVAADVVTVEPGVYHVGWGGIRIEDCVLVTPDGGEVLGSAPKQELIEVKGTG